MKITTLAVILLLVGLDTPSSAQTTPAPGTVKAPATPQPATTPATAKPAPATPPATTPAAPRRILKPVPSTIVVRDFSGSPVADVSVTISGAGQDRRELTTDKAGSAALSLADGTYRLRFEHENFITLEREVTIRSTRADKIDVALNRAPPPPPPPPPAPAPTPPPPEPPPAPAPVAVGPPTNVSIPTFLDKNFIGGREPLKESVLGCTPDAITRVLQLRDPLAAHAHGNLDEVLYVVAGNGAIKIGEESTPVAAGSLSVIPRGLRHSIERQGKNPLIVLSTLSGASCEGGKLTQAR